MCLEADCSFCRRRSSLIPLCFKGCRAFFMGLPGFIVVGVIPVAVIQGRWGVSIAGEIEGEEVGVVAGADESEGV